MSTLIDELITKFTLDAKGYAEAGEKVKLVTKQMSEGFDHANERAREFARGIGEKLKFGELLAPLAALGTVTGLVDLGRDAIRTAQEFDVLERKIAGLTGSYAKAREVMKFSEQEAGRTGLFKPAELDEAAIALEKFGLSTQKYLPLVESLSAVTGEGMEEFANALGMLANGEGGRALRVLERAGITLQDLKKRGLNVSGEGKIVGSPQAAIGAIGGAVQSKFGGVLSEMMNSPEAKAGRFSVAWENALRTAGQAAEGAFLPSVEAVGNQISKISESGQVDRIANGFAALFNINGKGLAEVVQGIANTLETIPKRIQSVEEFFRRFSAEIVLFGKVWASVWVFNKIISGINAVGAAVIALMAVQKALTGTVEATDAAEAAFDILTMGPAGIALVAAAGLAAVSVFAALTNQLNEAQKAMEGLAGAGDGLPGDKDTEQHSATRKKLMDLIKQREEQIEYDGPIASTWDDKVKSQDAQIAALQKQYHDEGKDISKKKAAGAPGNALGGDAGGNKDAASTFYMRQIAENTKKALDLRKYAFGGGDLNRIGVTEMEVNKFNRGGAVSSGSHNGISAHTKQAMADIIAHAMEEVSGRTTANYMRSNMINSRG
jgi:hypothetical protein